jgi:hypothetical protein
MLSLNHHERYHTRCGQKTRPIPCQFCNGTNNGQTKVVRLQNAPTETIDVPLFHVSTRPSFQTQIDLYQVICTRVVVLDVCRSIGCTKAREFTDQLTTRLLPPSWASCSFRSNAWSAETRDVTDSVWYVYSTMTIHRTTSPRPSRARTWFCVDSLVFQANITFTAPCPWISASFLF